MEIIENAEDLLTIGLEPEKPKKAYTEIEKTGYKLVYEFSNDSKEQAFLKDVLAAPLKPEEAPIKVPPYGAIKREEEALKRKAAEEKYERRLAKLNKAGVEPKSKAKKEKRPNSRRTWLNSNDNFDVNNHISFNLTLQKSKLSTDKFLTEDIIRDQDYVLTQQPEQKVIKPKIYTKTELENEIAVINQINKLYISLRSKHLSQYLNNNGEVRYSTNKYSLTDSHITQHIRKKSTIGIFSGQVFTKFLCFDVDSRDLKYSLKLAKEVVNILKNIFKIDEDYINVSLSGSKGYHVEVFFEEMLENTEAKSLYLAVMSFIELKEGSDIEYRPNNTQGVKLPLSINQKTGNTCYFVDTNAFETIKDPLHILKVKQLSKNQVKSVFENKDLFTFESEKAEKFEEVFNKIKPVKINKEDKEKEVIEFLKKGQLIRPNTRHLITFKTAMFMNYQGQTEADTFQIIFKNLKNTWLNNRDMYSEDTTLKFIETETERIVKDVFMKNLTLADEKKEIKIYKSEMEAVISLDKIHLRNLLFSFIIHSKKYARLDGTFYFAYSTINEYGNAANRASVLKYITILQDLGLVEIVKRGTINNALTLERGRITSDTNVYRLTLDEPEDSESSININTTKKINMYKAAKQLIDKRVLKENVSRREWDKYFNKLYK